MMIHQGVYIPFTSITRIQMAELMNVSPYTVDKYAREGYKTPVGVIKLQKQENGQFLTEDVQKFMNIINKYQHATRSRKRKI